MMNDKKGDIIKQITAYSMGRYMSQFIGFFIAVIMRNLLGPLYMGMWSVMRIFLSYASYSELGAMQAIYYKIPLYRGRENAEEQENVKNIVFTFLIFTSIIASFLVFSAALIFKDKWPRELLAGFLMFPLFFIAQRLYSFYVMLLRAHKKFVVLGKAYLFDSIANLILILFLVGRFKLYGMYLVSIVLPVLDIAYLLYCTRYKIRLRFARDKVVSYIKFGFPIVLSAVAMLMLYSVDRIMIARWLGLVPLGYYSIAFMARTYTQELSQNFASVLSPYFIEDYGKSGDMSRVGRSIIKYTEATAVIMTAILGIAYIVLPTFVRCMMPKFQPGISAMKIIFLCTFFIVISGHLQKILVMKERQIVLMKITVFIVGMNIAFNYIALKGGLGLAGVAGASSISACLFFLGVSGFSMRYVKGQSLSLFLFHIFAPFMYSVSALFAVNRFVDMGNTAASLITKTVFFMILSLVPVFYLNKRTRIVNILAEILREKFISGKKTQKRYDAITQ